MFVADADLPEPVVKALQILQYGILRYSEIGAPVRPDSELMYAVLKHGGVLVTRDTGIPSQTYLFEYAQNGLTVVVLRWKESTPRDWQEMAGAILRDGERWEQIAVEIPSVISVSRSRSRARAWQDVPTSIIG
jgi:hypothetical protein